MIFNAGQKIEVIKSSKQTKSGSIGYVICSRDIGPYNVIQYEILFTKFGKSGKARFSMAKLRTDKIDIESCGPASSRGKLKRLVENCLLPPRGDYGSWKVDSKIQKVCQKSKNTAELETWDFMAYISSLSIFLCRTIKNYESESSRLHRQDMYGTQIKKIPPYLVGPYLAYMFNAGRGDVVEAYLDYFNVPKHRKQILEQLYKITCISRRPIMAVLESNRSSYDHMVGILTELAHQSNIKIRIPKEK